ncbi:MAG: hypothetical protein ACR2QE_18215 [Acidimicrobiales bacterium]
MDDGNEITESARLLLRWSWLIVGVAVLVGAVTYVFTRSTIGEDAEAEAVVAVSEAVAWPHHFSTRDAYIAAATETGVVEGVVSTTPGVQSVDVSAGPDATGDVRIVITASADDTATAIDAAEAVADGLIALGATQNADSLAEQTQQVEDELAVVTAGITEAEAQAAQAAAIRDDDDAPDRSAAEADFYQARSRLDGLERTRADLEQDLGQLRIEAAGLDPEIVHVSAATVLPVAGTSAGAIALAAGALAGALTAALVPFIARRRGRVGSARRVRSLVGDVPVLDLGATPMTAADGAGLVLASVGAGSTSDCVVMTAGRTIAAEPPLVDALSALTARTTSDGVGGQVPIAALTAADAIVVAVSSRDSIADLSATTHRLDDLGLEPSCVVLLEDFTTVARQPTTGSMMSAAAPAGS